MTNGDVARLHERDEGGAAFAHAGGVAAFDVGAARDDGRSEIVAFPMAPRDEVTAEPRGRVATGTLRFFNHDLGYGVIAPDGGGTEVIVYITGVESSEQQALSGNRRVRFEVHSGGTRCRIIHIMRGNQDLAWSPDLSVGIATIDAQHKGMIDRYMALVRTLDPDGDTSRFHAAFCRLMAFTREHFDAEERVMRNIRFEDYETHKAAHAKLLRDAEDFGHSVASHFTLHECAAVAKWFRHWLVTHLQEHDLAIGRFVVRNA